MFPLIICALVVGCSGSDDTDRDTDTNTDPDADTDTDTDADADADADTDTDTDTDVPDFDADDDGVLVDQDCDDGDPSVGLPGTLFPDVDLDGYGDADASAVEGCPGAGLTADAADCDDTDGSIHPGATEVWCDLVDRDCDGQYWLDEARWNGIYYPVAQDALDAASDDAIVEICYPFGQLTVDHPLQLTAAPPGSYAGDGMTVTAASGKVSVSALSLRGGRDLPLDVDGLEVGGCIAVFGGADVEIDGAAFEACSGDKGTAIFASTTGTVTVRNSTFTDNDGSAILATSELVVEDSTFELNVGDGREGGAIWSSSDLTLTRVTFDRNTATLGGGAVYHTGPSATLTDVTFLDNSTDGNGGGAVFSGGANSLTDVVFTANTAQGNGGGAVLSGTSNALVNVDVDGNTAVGNGGGIWSSSAMTTVSGGIFTGNTAVDGGAIALDGAGSWIGGTSDTNTASGAGGGISAVGTWTISDVTTVGDDAFFGDGLGVKNGSTVTLADSEFVGNFLGRTVYVDDSQLYASAVVVTGPSVYGMYITSGADVQLEDCTIDGADGDGLYLTGGTATLTSSIISNNDTGVLIRNVSGIAVTSINSTFIGNLIDVDPILGDPFTSVDGTFTCDMDACYE